MLRLYTNDLKNYFDKVWRAGYIPIVKTGHKIVE